MRVELGKLCVEMGVLPVSVGGYLGRGLGLLLLLGGSGVGGGVAGETVCGIGGHGC